jgi:hypothetical protein
VGIPVSDETTAEPPVNNMAVTRMLVIKPKTVKTRWASMPYLALMTSRKVWMYSISEVHWQSLQTTYVSIGSSSLQLNCNRSK